MKPPALIATTLLISPVAFAAEPADSVRACRALSDAATRLACYDAVTLPLPAPPVTAAPAAAPVRPMPAAAAAVVAPPTAAVATAKPGDAQFGLEAQRAAQQQEVSSRISGDFEGWGPSTRLKLDNGQVWQIVDGSSGVYYLRSPQVKVTRAAMGSFRLEIDGAKQAPRVRRVE